MSDGSFTLTAAGRVDLADLSIIANAASSVITVTAQQDLLVRSVVAGLFLETATGIPDGQTVSSLGRVTLTSLSGMIRQNFDDPEADIITGDLILRAATGILNLEIAVNTLDAETAAGAIILHDLDGLLETRPGLVVLRAVSGLGINSTVSVTAENELRVLASALVRGDHLALTSVNDNLFVEQPGSGESIQYTQSVAFVAAGTVDLYRFFNAPERIEYRTGSNFLFGPAGNRTTLIPGNLTSNTIIIQTPEALAINGTLTARDRVELISDRDITITGQIVHVAGGSNRIGELILRARGLTPMNVNVGDTGFVSVPSGSINIQVATLRAETFQIRALRDIYIEINDNWALTGFVGGLTGFEPADNIRMKIAQNLTVTGGIVAAHEEIILEVNSITVDGASVFIADHLLVDASNAIAINTLVSSVVARSRISGNILINEASDLYADLVMAQNGSITLNTGGTLWARQIMTLVDSAANFVHLKASGDLYLDIAEAGVLAGTQKTAANVTLDSLGTIYELPRLVVNETTGFPLATDWRTLFNAAGAPVLVHNGQTIAFYDNYAANAFGYEVFINGNTFGTPKFLQSAEDFGQDRVIEIRSSRLGGGFTSGTSQLTQNGLFQQSGAIAVVSGVNTSEAGTDRAKVIAINFLNIDLVAGSEISFTLTDDNSVANAVNVTVGETVNGTPVLATWASILQALQFKLEAMDVVATAAPQTVDLIRLTVTGEMNREFSIQNIRISAASPTTLFGQLTQTGEIPDQQEGFTSTQVTRVRFTSEVMDSSGDPLANRWYLMMVDDVITQIFTGPAGLSWADLVAHFNAAFSTITVTGAVDADTGDYVMTLTETRENEAFDVQIFGVLDEAQMILSNAVTTPLQAEAANRARIHLFQIFQSFDASATYSFTVNGLTFEVVEPDDLEDLVDQWLAQFETILAASDPVATVGPMDDIWSTELDLTGLDLHALNRFALRLPGLDFTFAAGQFATLAELLAYIDDLDFGDLVYSRTENVLRFEADTEAELLGIEMIQTLDLTLTLDPDGQRIFFSRGVNQGFDLSAFSVSGQDAAYYNAEDNQVRFLNPDVDEDLIYAVVIDGILFQIPGARRAAPVIFSDASTYTLEFDAVIGTSVNTLSVALDGDEDSSFHSVELAAGGNLQTALDQLASAINSSGIATATRTDETLVLTGVGGQVFSAELIIESDPAGALTLGELIALLKEGIEIPDDEDAPPSPYTVTVDEDTFILTLDAPFTFAWAGAVRGFSVAETDPEAGINLPMIRRIQLSDAQTLEPNTQYTLTLDGEDPYVFLTEEDDTYEDVVQALIALINANPSSAVVASVGETDLDLVLTAKADNTPFAAPVLEVVRLEISEVSGAAGTQTLSQPGTMSFQVTELTFSGSFSNAVKYVLTLTKGGNTHTFTVSEGSQASLSGVVDSLVSQINTASLGTVASRVGTNVLRLTTDVANRSFTANVASEDTSVTSGGQINMIGDYVLILQEGRTGSFGLEATGNLSVVSLPTNPGETILLGAGGDLVVVDSIDVGAGTVTLSAPNGGLALGGQITAGTLNLSAATDLSLLSRVNTLNVTMSGGGSVTIQQQGNLTLSLAGQGGNLIVELDGDLNITDMTGFMGNVTIVTPGSVTFGSGVTAGMGAVTITAGGSVTGSINGTSLNLEADGVVNLVNGQGMVIESLNSNGHAVSVQAGGTVTVNSDITVDGNNALTLSTTAGALNVNRTLTSGSGNVTLSSASGMSLSVSAAINSATGLVSLNAGSGSLTMTSATWIRANAGQITLDAGGDITVGKLRSSSTDDLLITSGGAVIDAGDSPVDIGAPNATLVIRSDHGVGAVGDALDIQVARLDLINRFSGDVVLEHSGSLTILQLDQRGPGLVDVESINGYLHISALNATERGVKSTSGSVRLYAGGTNGWIFVYSEIRTTGGAVSLTAETGDIILADGIRVGGIGSITLRAPNGSLLNDPDAVGWRLAGASFDPEIDWALRLGKFTVNTATGEIVTANIEAFEVPNHLDNGVVLRAANGPYVQTQGHLTIAVQNFVGLPIPGFLFSPLAIVVDAARITATSSERATVTILATGETEVIPDERDAGSRGGNTDISNLTGSQNVTAPIDAGGENITIISDSVAINETLRSANAILTIRPINNSRPISLGTFLDGAPNTLNLSVDELARILDGFSEIVIGNPFGSHVVTIGDPNLPQTIVFRDNVSIYAPIFGGHIYLNQDLLGLRGANIRIFGSGATLDWAANVAAEGSLIVNDSILIDGQVHAIAGARQVTVADGSAFAAGQIVYQGMDLAGATGTALVHLVSGNHIFLRDLNGTFTTGSSLRIDGAAQHSLVTEVSLSNTGNLVLGVLNSGHFLDAKNGASDTLTLKANGGNITINSSIGQSNAMGTIRVENAVDVTFNRSITIDGDLIIYATGSVNFNGNVIVTGNIIVIGTEQIYFAPDAQVSAGPGRTIHLQSNNIDLPQSRANAVSSPGGVLILETTTLSRAIKIAEPFFDGNSDTLNITLQDLLSLQTGFARILIGRERDGLAQPGSGNVRIGAKDGGQQFTFFDPVEIYGNNITVEDYFTVDRRLWSFSNLTLVAHNNITITNEIHVGAQADTAGVLTLHAETGSIRQNNAATLPASEAIRAHRLNASAAEGIRLLWTEINELNALNRGTIGNIRVHTRANADFGITGDLLIVRAEQSHTGGDGNISISTDLGDITLTAVGAADVMRGTSRNADRIVTALGNHVGIPAGTGIVVRGAGSVLLVASSTASQIGEDPAGVLFKRVGDGRTITTNALVQTTTGAIRLLADGDVRNNALIEATGEGNITLDSRAATIRQHADVFSAGGLITFLAGDEIRMEAATRTDAAEGAIAFVAENAIHLGALYAQDEISLVSRESFIRAADGFAGDFNLDGGSTQLSLQARDGIGLGATPLLSRVASLNATVTHGGGIYLTEADDLEVNLSGIAVSGSEGNVVLILENGRLTVEGQIVTTGSSGNIRLDARNAGREGSLAINANLISSLGHITLLADDQVVINGIRQINALADLTGIEVQAGGDILMSADTRLNAVNGNQRLSAGGNILLGRLSAGTGSVSVQSGGWVRDAIVSGPVNVTAAAVRLDAGTGIGQAATPVRTLVNTLAARAASGGLFLTQDADLAIGTVSAVGIQRVLEDGTLAFFDGADADLSGLLAENNGHLVLVTETDLVLDQAIAATGSGNIRIESRSGDLTLNAALDAGTGHITLLAAGTLTQNATVQTGGAGTLDVEANTITMLAGALSTTVNGNIRYAAAETLTLARLSTPANISLIAERILSGESGVTHLTATALRMVAEEAIGTAAAPIHTDITRLAARSGGEGLFLSETGDLLIAPVAAISVNRVPAADPSDPAELTDSALQDVVLTGEGEAVITAGGSLTVADGTQVTTVDGDIQLTAEDDLLISEVLSANGDISATSLTGAILDNLTGTGANFATAGRLTLSAFSGIGPVRTAVGELSAVNADSGSIRIEQVGDVELVAGGVVNSAAAGHIHLAVTGSLLGNAPVSATANILLTATEDLTLNTAVTATGGAITLLAGDDLNVNAPLSAALTLDLEADRSVIFGTDGAAVTANGNIRIAAGDDLVVTGVNAGTASVSLIAGGAVSGLAEMGDLDVHASALRIVANGDIGLLRTQVGRLAVIGGGSLVLHNTGDLLIDTVAAITVGRVHPADLSDPTDLWDPSDLTDLITQGTITLHTTGDLTLAGTAKTRSQSGDVILSAGGYLLVSTVEAPAGNVTLAAGDRILDNLPANSANLLAAGRATLTAVHGIGHIRIDVDEVSAVNSTSGHIYLTADNGVTVAGDGLATQGGNGSILLDVVSGDLVAEAPISAHGTGDIHLLGAVNVNLNGDITTAGHLHVSAAQALTQSTANTLSAEHIRLVSGADLTVGAMAADAISLLSGAAILHAGSGELAPTTLRIEAEGDVGAFDAPVRIANARLAAASASGSLFLLASGDITVGEVGQTTRRFEAADAVDASLAGLTVNGGGNLILGVDGDLTVLEDIASLGTGFVSIRVEGHLDQQADIFATGAGTVDLRAGTAEMTAVSEIRSGSGDIRVDVAGSLDLSVIRTLGNVSLLAGGLTDAGVVTNVFAADLRIQATGTIGSGADPVRIDLMRLSLRGGDSFIRSATGLNIGETTSAVVSRIELDGAAAHTVTDPAQGDFRSSGSVSLVVESGILLLESSGELETQGDLFIQTLNGDISQDADILANGGHITLLAAGDLLQYNGSSLRTTGTGTVDIEAVNVVMSETSEITAVDGNIRIAVSEDLFVGRIATAADLSLIARDITDTAGTAEDLAADNLRISATGQVGTLQTTVNAMAARADGLFLINSQTLTVRTVPDISVNRLTADLSDPSDLTDAALSEILSSGAVVLVAESGDLITESSGRIEAAGNLLLEAARDVRNEADVVSTGGHLSVDAGRDLLQDADFRTQTAGGTIAVLAGRDITQTDGVVSRTTNGNIRYEADGILTVASLDAGSAAISLIASSILDGGDADADLIAGTLRMTATLGIGHDGTNVNALDTRVGVLTATSGIHGLYLNEFDALTLDRIGHLTFSRVSRTGSSAEFSDAEREDVISSGAVNIAADSFLLLPGITITVIDAEGGVTLLARDGDIDLRGVINGHANAVQMEASEDILFSSAAEVLTDEANVLLAAGGAVTMDSGSAIRSQDGNVTLLAQGDVRVSFIDAADGNVLISSALGAILDNQTPADADNILAAELTLAAAQGVGTAANALEFNVSTVSGIVNQGGLYLRDSGSVSAGGLTALNGGNLVLRAEGSLTLTSTVAAAGAGNIHLAALSGTLTTGTSVEAGSGAMTLSAHDDLTINGNLTAAGGIDLQSATANVFMAQGAVLTTVGGNVVVQAADRIQLSRIDTRSAGPQESWGNVGLFATDGSITVVNGGRHVDAHVLSLSAGTHIGTVSAPIETEVVQLAARAENGGIFVEEASDLRIVTVASVSAQRVGADGETTTVALGSPVTGLSTLAGDGDIVLVSGGTLNLDEAVTAHGGGRIVLEAAGDLVADAAIGSSDGSISLLAGGSLFLNADGVSSSASVYAEAESGELRMVGTVTVAGDTVRLAAAQDLRLGEVSASSISVVSANGDILRASGSGVNLSATTALRLHAAGEIGLAHNPLRTHTPLLAAYSSSASIALRETDALTVGEVAVTTARLGRDLENTPVPDAALRGLTTGTDGDILLETLAGNLTLAESVAADGAGDVFLKAAGSLIMDASATVTADGLRLVAGNDLQLAALTAERISLLAGAQIERVAGVIIAEILRIDAGGFAGTAANPLQTNVHRLAARVGSHLFLDEADGLVIAGDPVAVNELVADSEANPVTDAALEGVASLNDGHLVIRVLSGELTVLESVKADGEGNMLLQTQGGAMTVEADLLSGTGHITLISSGAVTLNAGVITGGDVVVDAGAGLILDATVEAANVRLDAAGSLHLGRIEADAVSLISGEDILGSGDPQIISPMLRIEAAGTVRLTVTVNTLAAHSTAGDLDVVSTGSVTVGTVGVSTQAVLADAGTQLRVDAPLSGLRTALDGNLHLLAAETLTVLQPVMAEFGRISLFSGAAMSLQAAVSTQGDLAAESGAALTVAPSVTLSAEVVRLAAIGILTLGRVEATTVSLISGAAIVNGSGAGLNVYAESLRAVAIDAIGTLASPLNLEVGLVAAFSLHGDLSLRSAGEITVGTVGVVTGRFLGLDDFDNLTDTALSGLSTLTGTILLWNDSGDIILDEAVTSGSGLIVIDSAAALQLNSGIETTGEVSLNAADAVIMDAPTSINASQIRIAGDGITVGDLTAATISLVSTAQIDGSGLLSGTALRLEAIGTIGELNSAVDQIAAVSATGDITLVEADDITLGLVGASATGFNRNTGELFLLTDADLRGIEAFGDVTLTSLAGGWFGLGDGQLDVHAGGHLDLNSSGGIGRSGAALRLDAESVTLNNPVDGSAYLVFESSIDFGGIHLGGRGYLYMTVHGDLLLSGPIRVDGGSALLTVHGLADLNADITVSRELRVTAAQIEVAAGVTLQSGSHTVTLRADSDLLLSAGSTVRSSGNSVDLRAGGELILGRVEAARRIDLRAGGSISAAAADRSGHELTAPVLRVQAGGNVLGLLTAVDRVDVSAGGIIQINETADLELGRYGLRQHDAEGTVTLNVGEGSVSALTGEGTVEARDGFTLSSDNSLTLADTIRVTEGDALLQVGGLEANAAMTGAHLVLDQGHLRIESADSVGRDNAALRVDTATMEAVLNAGELYLFSLGDLELTGDGLHIVSGDGRLSLDVDGTLDLSARIRQSGEGDISVTADRLHADASVTTGAMIEAGGDLILLLQDGITVSGHDRLRLSAEGMTIHTNTGTLPLEVLGDSTVRSGGVTVQGGSGDLDLLLTDGSLTLEGDLRVLGTGELRLDLPQGGLRAEDGVRLETASGDVRVSLDTGILMLGNDARLRIDTDAVSVVTRAGSLPLHFTRAVVIRDPGLRIAIAPGVLDVAGVRLDQDPANSGLSLDVASGLVRLAMTEGIGVSGTSPLRARAATFTAVSATGDVAVDFTHAVAVTAEGVTLQGGSGSIDLNVLSGNLTTSGIIVHDGSGDVNLSASAAGGQIRAIATHQPGAMIRVADGNLDLRADSGVVVTDAARLLVDSPRFTGGTRTGNLRVGFTGGVEVGSVSILEGNGLLELLVHSGNFTTAANAVIANLSTGNLVVNVLQGGLTMHAGSEFRVANGLLDLRARDTLLLARLFSLGSDTYLQSFEGSVLGLDGISVHLITPGGFHVPQIFAASGQQIQLVVDADELDVNGTFRLSRGIEDFIFLQEMIP